MMVCHPWVLFLSSHYLCFLCLRTVIPPPASGGHSFFPIKRDKERLWMLLIFLPNSQIFCKSKWHILKMYMLSAEYVHAFFWLFFSCYYFYLLVVNLEKEAFVLFQQVAVLSRHISVAVKSFGNRSWVFWAEYLIWQYQYDSNNPLLVSVIKRKHSCRSVSLILHCFKRQSWSSIMNLSSCAL